jgi:D-alanyl-D-alanine carboxypeptidase (penicillin-binding protein 5/6)
MGDILRKLVAIMLIMLTLLPLSITGAAAAEYTPDFEVPAAAVYLVNLDAEQVIYQKNAHQPIAPASLTKLMTAILALENCEDLDGTQVTLKGYIQNEMYIKNNALGGISLAGLLQGDTLTMRDLLYAILLPSGNEAAMMIADEIGDGSIPYFIEMMNKRAREIGAMNTTFRNVNGLPGDGNVTTAYDMYLIARHAMSLPGFMDIASSYYYNGGTNRLGEPLHWNTTNRMIVPSSPSYYPPVRGVKTGTTEESGYCFISTATRNGYNYMAVVMGVPYERGLAENPVFPLTRKLYEWCFNTFSVKTLLERGKSFGEAKLKLAWGKDHVSLMSSANFSALIPTAISISSVVYEPVLPEVVRAPVKVGDEIGHVRIILAGEEIGQVVLVASEDVEASRLLIVLDKLHSLTQSFWFKFAVVFVVISVVLYIALMIVRNRNRRRYGRVRRRKDL